jgi:hypothetical protein
VWFLGRLLIRRPEFLVPVYRVRIVDRSYDLASQRYASARCGSNRLNQKEFASMSRRRPQLSRRSRLSAYLESLETRQMLSASALAPAAHTSPPAAQPAGLVVQPLALSINNPAVTTANAVYTPLQIRMAYGVTSIPNQGQGTTIAIVDAYADPDITSDVALFSTDFGLPQMDGVGGDPTFSISTPTGQPAPAAPTAGTWDVEESLDVEYAHSIAPYANIDLVEAATNSGDQLFAAEVDGQSYESGIYYAKNLPGVDVVSNSYGGSEFNGETAYDSEFNQPAGHNPVAITYSTGDSAAPGAYPAFSPNVVAAGGTSLYTASSRGAYGSETAWSKVTVHGVPEGGGGGVSKYEATPSYQSSNGVNYGARATPDLSMDANPNTGVLVIDSYDNAEDFLEVGGTSLASPMTAAVIDLGDGTSIAGGGTSLSTSTVLNSLYGTYNSANYGNDFHDITTGNNGFAAGVGYDLATGIGSPKANTLVPVLASAGAPPPAATLPVGTGGIGPIHIGGAATMPIVTSIPTESTIAMPSVQDAMPSIAEANVTTTSMTAPLANVVSTPTASPISNSSATPAPVNDMVTAEGSHSAVMTTTEFASNGLGSSVGADADGAAVVMVVPSAADGSVDAAVPAMLSGNVSDLVFADRVADSLFDRMAEAPAAVTSTDNSRTAEIVMLAGAALAVYGFRSTYARGEEKVRMLPVT